MLFLRKAVCVLYVLAVVVDARYQRQYAADPLYETVPNITVIEGRDTVIPCVVKQTGEGKPKVAWMHIDRQMIISLQESIVSRVPRYGVTYDGSSIWSLHLLNAQVVDSGWYMCQVNSNPLTKKFAYVTVVVPPKIVDKDTDPASISVREHSDAVICCEATGIPLPVISWKREDGKELRGDYSYRDSGNDSIASCLIHPRINRREMGAFFCIASNKLPPTVSKRYTIEVEFPPTLSIPTQLVGVPHGTNITIECNVEGHPRAITLWQYKSNMLVPSQKYSMENVYEGYKITMTLVIANASDEDFDSYWCLAKNSLGDAEGSIRLYGYNPNENVSTETIPIPSKEDASGGTRYTTRTLTIQPTIPSITEPKKKNPYFRPVTETARTSDSASPLKQFVGAAALIAVVVVAAEI